MSLLDLVRLTRHNLGVILLATLIGGLLGAAYAFTRPNVYQATALGVVVAGAGTTLGEASSGSAIAAERAAGYVTLMDTTAVWQRIAVDEEVVANPGSGSGSAAAAVVGTTSMIRIVARSGTPKDSVILANAAMRALAAEALKLETLNAPGGGGQSTSAIQIVPYQQASGSGRLDTSNWPISVGGGLLVGLCLAYAYAFIRQQLDVRIRTVKDVEEITGHSVLGIVPDSKELKTQRDPNSAVNILRLGQAGEALRQLRTNLRYVNVDQPPRAIVITSPNPGEGKSTISSNLARLIARSGQSVVLIDADLRRPMQHKIFHIDNVAGLTQVLAGSVDLTDAVVQIPGEHLQVLPSGKLPPNPSEILGSRRMRDLLDTLSRDHFVIVDAPPVLAVTDPGLVAAACDGAILVSRVGNTYKEQLRMSVKVMNQVGASLLGSVLHRAPRKGMGSVVYGAGYGGRYDSYYGTYYGSKVELSDVVAVDPETTLDRADSPRRGTAD